ncbi:MAG: hypothetical protein AAGJ31_09305, partial [Verrucomicrobiota bacterium]
SAEDLKLPTSEILRRTVATKEQKGSLMVRKIMLWKTHKEEVSEDYPAYVLHLTDFSPNRKSPLDHEVRVSHSRDQLERMFSQWKEKYFVQGWTEVSTG